MWNESNDSWPGGFSAGPPYDTARIHEWIDAHDALTRLVARDGAAIIGYCDVAVEGSETLFIPLLNVHPKHQGRGVGRDLLLRAIATASATPGIRRLILRTWPANVNAVPLYKKAGFFWEPGTAVSMVNYLPQVISHPLAAGFLREHEWYRALRRDLSLTEDDEEWHGYPAFTYRFVEGGDRLTVVIDRAAHRITAIETDALSVQGWRGRAVGATGARMPVSLAVAATPGTAVRVAAVANRGATLTTALPDTFIAGDSPAVLATGLQLPDETDVAGPEPHLAGLRITASTGDLVAPIDLIVPTVRPVRLDYTGDHVIRAGAVAQLNFRAVNMLGEPLRLRVDGRADGVLALPDLIGATGLPCEMVLAAGAADGFAVSVVASGPGSGQLHLSCLVELESGTCAYESTVQLIAAGAGSAIAAAHDGVCRLVNDFAAVEATDGAVVISDRLAGRDAARISRLSFGMPFRDAAAGTWAGRPIEGSNGASVELTGRLADGPVVVRRISVTGPVVTIRDRLTGPAASSAGFRLARLAVKSALRSGWITAPLAAGVTTAEVVEGEYPLGQDYRDSRELISEGWLAAWDGHGVVGLMFSGRPSTVFWSRWLGQLTYEIPPSVSGGAVDLPELRVYAGPGDWRAVRALWLGARDGRSAEQIVPAPVTRAELVPRPVLAGDDELRLTIENRRDTPRAGDVTVTLPLGWLADPAALTVEPVVRQAPVDAPLVLRRDCHDSDRTAGAAQAEIVWQAGSGCLVQTQPVFCLAGAGDVMVKAEPGDMWSVANGRLTARIGTQPAACLFSLCEGEREYLASSYPAAGRFVDIAPWYGGIHPQVSFSRADWPGRGHVERYRAEAVTIRGSRGFNWHGVRLTTSERPPGTERSLDLLTLPQSNVLAVVTRVRNDTGADLTLSFGFDAYPARRGNAMRYLADAGTPIERFCVRDAGEGHATLHDLAWLAVGDTPALAIVAPGARMRVDDYGAQGLLASTVVPWSVPANGASARLAFVIAADGPEAAALYSEFKRFTELP